MNRIGIASLILTFVLFGLALAVQGSCATVLEPTELPPTDKITPQLYATGFETADGLAFDSYRNLFVSNYRGNGNIGRITEDATAGIFCDLRKLAPAEGRTVRAAGLKVTKDDRLIVADAGAGRLLRVSTDGKTVEILADRFEGSRFGVISHVALDLAGNVYFTDSERLSVESSAAENRGVDSLADKESEAKEPETKKTPDAAPPVGFVYRYNVASQKVERLVTDLAAPTGLAVTPDGKLLCVAESGRSRILSFQIGEQKLGEGRLVIDFSKQKSSDTKARSFTPRGMIFDADGRLYVAMGTVGMLHVVDLEKGATIRQYKAGGSKVTNCHFHGHYLYSTVAAKEAVFRIKLGVEGHSYTGP